MKKNPFDIISFRNGDVREQEKLYQEHFRPLCLYVEGLIGDKTAAENIVSECFLNMWKIREQFEDADRIKAYLYLVARQAAFDHLRQKNSGNS